MNPYALQPSPITLIKSLASRHRMRGDPLRARAAPCRRYFPRAGRMANRGGKVAAGRQKPRGKNGMGRVRARCHARRRYAARMGEGGRQPFVGREPAEFGKAARSRHGHGGNGRKRPARALGRPPRPSAFHSARRARRPPGRAIVRARRGDAAKHRPARRGAARICSARRRRNRDARRQTRRRFAASGWKANGKPGRAARIHPARRSGVPGVPGIPRSARPPGAATRSAADASPPGNANAPGNARRAAAGRQRRSGAWTPRGSRPFALRPRVLARRGRGLARREGMANGRAACAGL